MQTLSQLTSIPIFSSRSELVDPDSVVFLDEEDLDLTLSLLLLDALDLTLVSDHRVRESLRVEHLFVYLHHQILLPATQAHYNIRCKMPFRGGFMISQMGLGRQSQ